MTPELAQLALTENEKLILVAVLAAAMVFVVFFELRYMRGKTKEVRHAAQKRDEAYNAILTTRSVINVMQRQGADTGGPQSLVASAKRAMDRGDFDRCMDLCEQAKDELTNPAPKSGAAKPKPSEGPEKERLEMVAENILSAREPKAGAGSYKGTKLPVDQDSNYLSAKFEINTAKADIRKALDRRLDTSEAQSLVTEAEGAYVTGSYSRALSLAVRARKAVSSEAAGEAIPLKVEAEPEPQEAPAEPEVFDVQTRGQPCKSCGAMLEPGDSFCGRCGSKVELERVCGNCGSRARPADSFCRKCGSKID